MSISKSRLAYTDCYSIMDIAIGDSAGIRVKTDTREAGLFFRMRCHQARALMREHLSKVYAVGHPLHGTCQYDALIIREPRELDDGWWVFFEKIAVTVQGIVSLSGREITMETQPKALPPPLEPGDDFEDNTVDEVEEEALLEEAERAYEEEPEPMPSIGITRRA